MIRRLLPLAALLAAPLAAQESKPPTPYDRAIAAGYKALTLCSAMFNGGRTQAQAEALELTGIYREYQPIVATLKASVLPAFSQVLVPWSNDLPARRASWNRASGCMLDPIGTGVDVVGSGAAAPPPPAGRTLDRWPFGDGGIAPRPAPALRSAVDAAFTATGRTTGAVIVQDGRIVAERYADGFTPFTANRTWSVAKSLTATLIGAAVQQGALRLSDPARIPEWSDPADPRHAITHEQLLRMASGLHSATAGNRTDAVYFGGTAVTEETVAWPLEAKPGTRFRYANNDMLLAMRSLRATLGEQRYATFPRDALFGPLGMAHTVAERDWRGNYILSSQVWSTARDLARFGLLYLNDGVWNGQRLLPPGWAKLVATPAGPQPDGRDEGYGLGFWLMNRSPGLPADTYAAFGNRGQFVVIVPSRRVVIVRRGEDMEGAAFRIAPFAAAVLKALD